ncbi:SigE family RNA polymerase sigma factor [Hamadaea tsunoensis]|uniref:SigE family RNA polymerase sigma factor n=1 Tax=Hamadaea tsunoensis TaxID=53368 RepID=UPI0004281B41|nr:SigE family RNA polymerase sigma factor [Hamadaea tsunoensis]
MSGRRDFAEFYTAAFAPLTSQLHAFVGDHAEAQDLVQEAFCRALTKWPTVSTYDDPFSWVRKVAWNLAISRWRRARRLRLRHRELVPPDVEPPTAGEVDLTRALGELPAQHRQVVVLHYLADMSVAEIAEFTGSPEGTIKAWLHRARRTLAGLLAAEDEEVPDV